MKSRHEYNVLKFKIEVFVSEPFPARPIWRASKKVLAGQFMRKSIEEFRANNLICNLICKNTIVLFS